MTQIIAAALGLAALRDAGYRSIGTAIAELVDNSIEAKAKNIEIIAHGRKITHTARTTVQIFEIGVLDDGIGMAEDILSKCLSLGWGTRLNTREGLGRYGFGLKGASISQARRVEVYSWISPGDVYMAELDLDRIEDENLQVLEQAIKKDLPRYIQDDFSDLIGESGTLILWKNMDKMEKSRFKTSKGLITEVSGDLCRIYRHFLDDDDEYGERRNIGLSSVTFDESNSRSRISLRANDPLYLLTPNNLPNYEDECTNVLREEVLLPVLYEDVDGKENISNVKIKISIAKPETQALGGNALIGKHYAKNQGISFVRAGREIDFGEFNFVSVDQRHRWWGIEVRFEPVLDELFGLTNNKQSVRNIRRLSEDQKIELVNNIDELSNEDKLLLDLNKILNEHISSLLNEIKSRKSGKKKELAKTTTESQVNEKIKRDRSPTQSAEESLKKTNEQKIKEISVVLLAEDSTLTSADAEEIAKSHIDRVIDISEGSWPGDLFLDRKVAGNASVGIINRETEFYDHFWKLLEESPDKKGFEAMKILIMALIRAEDELVAFHDRKLFERFRNRWGFWVENLIPLIK